MGISKVFCCIQTQKRPPDSPRFPPPCQYPNCVQRFEIAGSSEKYMHRFSFLAKRHFYFRIGMWPVLCHCMLALKPRKHISSCSEEFAFIMCFCDQEPEK